MSRVSGLSFLPMLILAGCAAPTTRVDKSNDVVIGFSETAWAQLRTAERSPGGNAVFVRLRATQDRLIATELSASRLHPASNDEEVLAYVVDANTVLPAFESAAIYNPPTGTFQCGFITADKMMPTTYHPCGSGSKLVVASKGASAARNTVALITTLGLASGIDYAVDIEQVSAVLKDQQIMDKIKRYRVLLAVMRAAEADVRQQDRALQSAAKPAIRVVNQTGFATPVVLPESLNYSFAREVAMGMPATLDLTTPDPFGAMQTLLDAHKAALLSNRTYRVSCPRTFSQGTFRGTLSCNSDVTERDGTLTPQVVVTLESVHEGLRFPDYEGRDKNLAVSVADNALVIANLTAQYLEVQSIAVYGGKDIQENSIGLSLAPQASNREPIPLRKLASDAILRRFRFDGVRKADLQRREHFAIAVKYRLGDGGNFKTFLGGKDVLLADLVRTR